MFLDMCFAPFLGKNLSFGHIYVQVYVLYISMQHVLGFSGISLRNSESVLTETADRDGFPSLL